MDWIDELEEEAWNVVIDELVWHLRQGRTPSSIRRLVVRDQGVEFCFQDHEPFVFKVDEQFLREHWSEAVTIIRRFPQLRSVTTVESHLDAPRDSED